MKMSQLDKKNRNRAGRLPRKSRHVLFAGKKLLPLVCFALRTGRVGAGRAGSGRAGLGGVGPGRVGSGRVGSDRAVPRRAGTIALSPKPVGGTRTCPRFRCQSIARVWRPVVRPAECGLGMGLGVGCVRMGSRAHLFVCSSCVPLAFLARSVAGPARGFRSTTSQHAGGPAAALSDGSLRPLAVRRAMPLSPDAWTPTFGTAASRLTGGPTWPRRGPRLERTRRGAGRRCVRAPWGLGKLLCAAWRGTWHLCVASHAEIAFRLRSAMRCWKMHHGGGDSRIQIRNCVP